MICEKSAVVLFRIESEHGGLLIISFIGREANSLARINSSPSIEAALASSSKRQLQSVFASKILVS